MPPRSSVLALLICASLLPVARAQLVQQGNKLVGTGYVGNPEQGDGAQMVALSADGNTALVGGWDDNPAGAVLVYTRSAGSWSQQGGKLVGSGTIGSAGQGAAVALSADGNTAIVGGFMDNGGFGAAWIWTRSGGIWTQQGTKLIGAGAIGLRRRVSARVALSADGNTALVGGPGDNNSAGGGLGCGPDPAASGLSKARSWLARGLPDPPRRALPSLYPQTGIRPSSAHHSMVENSWDRARCGHGHDPPTSGVSRARSWLARKATVRALQ